MIFSHYQIKPLLEFDRQEPQRVRLSIDLGRGSADLLVDSAGLHLPADLVVPWADLEKIAADENGVYRIFPLEDGYELQKVRLYSELTERAYSLFPTLTAPTMLVSGITMHRIVDCDPWEDTYNKITALGQPPTGRVLDTCMGLGYTAIQAAVTAEHVDTIELDPTVVEMCRLNPWSEGLFSAENITRHIGHAWDVIEEMADNSFQVIIHDPPMFGMAGELYSTDFYKELYRVLRRGGPLFHYIGNPKSRSGGRVTKGVIRRLKEAGFKRVTPRPQAFGVLAMK